LLTKPDFGGTHPLHVAVFRRDIAEVDNWISKLGVLDSIINFLGQSPLHIALAPESQSILQVLLDRAGSLINNTDKWGFTPLMYAAFMGYETSAAILIRHGASLSPETHVLGTGCDFISCAVVWGYEDILWGFLDDALSGTETSVSEWLWRRLAEVADELGSAIPSAERIQWIVRFCEQIFSARKPKSLDFTFGEGKILAHALRLPSVIERLISHGFSLFNFRDDLG
jgi:hypothetical protein